MADFDPGRNLENIIRQAEIIGRKLERRHNWCNWAQALISIREDTIHRLEAEKATLLAACKMALVGAEHEACGGEDPDPTWHCCDWQEVVTALRTAIAEAKG